MDPIQITEPSYSSNKVKKNDVAIGIDLGTTNSLVSIVKDGKPYIIGDIIPSVVSLSNDEILVGRNIEDKQSISSIKRLMGKSTDEIKTILNISRYNLDTSIIDKIQIIVGEKRFSPEEISAQILLKLKNIAEEHLGQKVTKAVITVPAYFNDGARNATKNAAQLAGIEVLRLLNEPTSAAVAYGLDESKEGKYIIYDFGGGTFDISILNLQKGIFQVLATSGNDSLGGDDIDALILEYLINKVSYEKLAIDTESLNTMLSEARRIKESLSVKSEDTAIIEILDKKHEIIITRDDLNNLISPLVNNTISILQNCIEDAKVALDEIEGIILVGGSTRVPLVKQKIEDLIQTRIFNNINPDNIVALGAAIQANNLTNGGGNILLDVVPLSLGLEVMGGIFERVIIRNTPIPVSISKEFTTYEDGQTAIVIDVLQGEREMAKDCRSLAKFTLNDIPPLAAGMAKISINFKVDADGLLIIEAHEKTTNKKQTIEVKPSYGLSVEQMQNILKTSYQHSEEDLNNRNLAQSKMDASKVIKELEKLLAKDEQLLSFSEVDKLRKQISILSQSILKNDRDQIDLEVKKLEEYSEGFISKRFTVYFKEALSGMSISDTKKKYLNKKE